MTRRLLLVALAATALAFAGCNNAAEEPADEPATTETSLNETTETAGEEAADTETAPATPPADGAAPADGASATPAPAPADNAATETAEVTLPGGTKYVDEVVGTGAEATPGKTVTVHYTGKLTTGETFDSSRSNGREPFSFPLGEQFVIKGWDEGVAGMKVGGKRMLTIPPDQAYGADGAGPIPPNSTLIFDIELLDVQ